MTRAAKKHRERFLVEQAAKSLGKQWVLGLDREHPDFFVMEGASQFGLEVCEVFTGPQDRAGAHMKATEAVTQRAVNDLRRQYETIEKVPLRVQLVGNMSAPNMAAVLPALVAEGLQSQPIAHHFVIDTGNGLRAHVTKAFRADWFAVNDRVGFVDRNPKTILDNAIEKKSKELPRYRSAAGPDIRLLLVADRIHNSGKMTLEDHAGFNLRGFHTVYFYPYPENARVLDAV